jgi:cell division protein FtsW
MLEKLKNIFKGDRILWNSVLVLGGLSIAAVYSASGALAYQEHDGNTLFFLFKQIFFIGFGILAVLIFQFIPYKYYFRFAPAIYVVSLLLLALTLIMGKSVNGAQRWLEIPLIHIQFQPSEIAKIALVIYAARILSVNQDDEKSMKTALIAILAITGLMSALLIFSGGSTTLLLLATVLVLLYVGRVKIKYILLIVGIFVIFGASFLFILSRSSNTGRLKTWKSRYETFFKGKDNGSDQANEAKVAIVTGGVFGKGPGNSVQRNVLPQSYSDFIYASIIEEYGWAGAAIIIALYLWILYRGINIINYVKNSFPAILALGLIFSLTIQAFANMAVAVGLFPVTGQALPFVSMGGTSNVITGITFGIILNISREAVIELNKIQNGETETESVILENLNVE